MSSGSMRDREKIIFIFLSTCTSLKCLLEAWETERKFVRLFSALARAWNVFWKHERPKTNCFHSEATWTFAAERFDQIPPTQVLLGNFVSKHFRKYEHFSCYSPIANMQPESHESAAWATLRPNFLMAKEKFVRTLLPNTVQREGKYCPKYGGSNLDFRIRTTRSGFSDETFS